MLTESWTEKIHLWNPFSLEKALLASSNKALARLLILKHIPMGQGETTTRVLSQWAALHLSCWMLRVGRKKSSDLLWHLQAAVSDPHWDWRWAGKAHPSTWRHSKSICEARTKPTLMVFNSIKQNKAESWHKEDTDPTSLKEIGAP